jgi:ABC-type uncharacterized transport system ATPase component
MALMNIFMITHDLKEGFEFGTRLLVFHKVRLDPQAPGPLQRHHHLRHPARRDRQETIRRADHYHAAH